MPFIRKTFQSSPSKEAPDIQRFRGKPDLHCKFGTDRFLTNMTTPRFEISRVSNGSLQEQQCGEESMAESLSRVLPRGQTALGVKAAENLVRGGSRANFTEPIWLPIVVWGSFHL